MLDDQEVVFPLPVPDVTAQGRTASRLAAAPALVAWWDAVPGFLLALDQQGRIAFANRSICQFLGVARREDLYGHHFGEAVNCPHAASSGCGTVEACRYCGIDQAVVSAESGRQAVQECRLTTHSGQPLDLRITTTPIKLDGERFTIMAMTDVSDEKRRQALERIFFHDLLNTAGAMLGYAELLGRADSEELPELGRSIARLTGGLGSAQK